MNTLINVVFPVFAIVALGYLAGHWRVLGADSAAALNRFVYYFALPPVLFVFPARQPIAEVLNWPFIGAFLCGGALTLALAAVANRLWFRHGAALFSLHGLAVIYPNTSYMGVPLFLTAYGVEGTMPAIVATLVGISVMVGGTIATLEATRAKGPSAVKILREVSVILVRNPLLIAIVLGIGFSVLAIPIPVAIGNFLDLMASAAGPAALFALGLSLVGRSLLGDMAEVSWIVALKLLAQPAITYLLVTHVFDMEPRWADAAVILSALPVGAVAFVIAQQYDLFVRRTSSAIVLSTCLSVVTVSALMIAFGIR
jgi:malonate transporter and related proteins